MSEKKTLVYLFGFTPWQGTQLDNISEIIKQQLKSDVKIEFILLHDGVIGTSGKETIPPSLEKLLNLTINVYAIKTDLLARGINPNNIRKRVKIIDYEDLVDILAKNDSIISWM